MSIEKLKEVNKAIVKQLLVNLLQQDLFDVATYNQLLNITGAKPDLRSLLPRSIPQMLAGRIMEYYNVDKTQLQDYYLKLFYSLILQSLGYELHEEELGFNISWPMRKNLIWYVSNRL